MYPNRRDGGPDQRNRYTRSSLRIWNRFYARVICTTAYIFIELQIARAAPAGFPGFLENPAKTIACGRHGGLFKRPLAISINGARTILDLPTCWRSEHDRALLPAVIKKVSRSNNRTWRDWHAPTFRCKLIFFFFFFFILSDSSLRWLWTQ